MIAYRVLLLITVASLHRHTLSQNSVFSVTPGTVTARLGSPARLNCQLARPQQGTFIRWALGDGITMIDFNQCNCQLMSPNSSLSSLYFNQTTQSSGGNYTCIAIGGSISGSRAVGSLVIAADPSITPNGFSVTYTQNDTFSLNISVGGIPQPEVTWMKDNADINPEVTRVMASSSGLQVKSAQYETAGRYRVQAANLADTVSETYNIFIRFVPRITMTRNPDIEEVPESTIVTVTCSVFSYPASSIHWQQQTAAGDDITLGTHYAMNSSSNMFRVDTKSTFMFNSSNIRGASSYCCSAVNEIGTTMECLHFTEDGAPASPSGFHVTERTPSSVTVQWERSSLDGVIYELRYHVDRPNEEWIVIKLQNNEATYTLSNLKPNTSYVLRITSVRMSIPSLPFTIKARTRISVPGDIQSFYVNTTLMNGTFVLTWEAPQSSVVDYYVIHIRWPANNNRTLNSTSTMVNINDLSENVVYMFAVQAVNDGGSGNITNYRSGVFCFTRPVITAQYTSHGATINVSWDLSGSVSDSVYSSSNIVFVVVDLELSRAFTSELIDTSDRHRCITNLSPSTRYEITVFVILNCTNVSSKLDVLTQSPTTADSFPSQNCILFDLPHSTTKGRLNEDSESTTPEAWVIVLIVMIPLLGVAVMLGIGIYCACKKRYTGKDPAEIPPVSSPSSQAPLHHNTRHHSASSYTGSFASGATTPIRSPSSYHSRSTGYRPALYNGRIDEQASVGHQY